MRVAAGDADWVSVLAGDVDTVIELAAGLEVTMLAESLGGAESLVEAPATMTRRDLTSPELAAAGPPEPPVRPRVGTEHSDDRDADGETELAAAFEWR